jgi:CHAD domain-containing protein
MRGPEYDREFLVNKIAMMRIKGKSTRSIIEFLQEKVGMGQTTAYQVLKDAQSVIVELQSTELEGDYADAIAQLEEEYETTKDKRVKLSIRQELNKLKGLYKPQRLDVTTNGKDVTISEVVIKIITDKNDIEKED